MAEKKRAPRNRTISLSRAEYKSLVEKLLSFDKPVSVAQITDSTICQDLFELLPLLPSSAFDLIFADPPYNLTKDFSKVKFRQTDLDSYEGWLESWLPEMKRLLKPDGSIYICGDWRSSSAIERVLLKYFRIRNRITWEREKGRGAKNNWKNNSEDIWYATASDEFTFNTEHVKVKRRVIAPYTDIEGQPKDWDVTKEGNYRITFPSNIWTDLTVPFWSMPENTDHPTQKPEKLLAKIILASSNPGDIVFDPFLGSGTTSVVAMKLGRRYVGVEINSEYCCMAEKRLLMARENPSIQGYTDDVFWERNTLAQQKNHQSLPPSKDARQARFFD